jgi:hypothetical protein
VRVFASALLLFAIITLPGCGSGVAISGTVVYDDGTPVEEGTVIGELESGGKSTVQGEIRNGSFSLGTAKPGDGVTPGVYKIMIVGRALGDSELAAGKKPAIAGKYGKFESSGLKIDASAGAKKDVKLVVSRPGKS